MTPSNGDARSLRRLADLLNVFERERRPLTVRFLVDALDAPRSSTSALLRTLVDLGLFNADRSTASYAPSVRFKETLKWVADDWQTDPVVSEVMEWLREATQETVVLSTVGPLRMEVVHCLNGPNEISLNLAVGRRLSLTGSSIGMAYLATLSSSELALILTRLQRNDPGLSAKAATTNIKRIKALGVAVVYDGVEQGGGAAALALPAKLSARPFVLSVGGPSQRMKHKEASVVKMLQSAVSRIAGRTSLVGLDHDDVWGSTEPA